MRCPECKSRNIVKKGKRNAGMVVGSGIIVKTGGEDYKHMGVRIGEKSKKILIPNKNYILIKRFSTKEGKQRINAGLYLKNLLDSDFIGIENHVNYIYKKDGELALNEAYGVVALLNSNLYNKYFQITNGCTQVNASEIRQMPFPSLDIIRSIGVSIRNLKRDDKTKSECIILNALKIDKKISDELVRPEK